MKGTTLGEQRLNAFRHIVAVFPDEFIDLKREIKTNGRQNSHTVIPNQEKNWWF